MLNYVYIRRIDHEYCPLQVLRRYTENSNAKVEPNKQTLKDLGYDDR